MNTNQGKSPALGGNAALCPQSPYVSRRKRSSERGFSIIETLIAMTIASTVVGFGVTLVVRAMRCEAAGARQVDFQRTAARATLQFRRDVARCLQATLDDDARALRLAFDADRVVEWRVEPHRLLRFEPLDDGAKRQESYEISVGQTCHVSLAGAPRRATLIFAPLDPADGAQLPYAARVVVTPGRWRSLGLVPEENVP